MNHIMWSTLQRAQCRVPQQCIKDLGKGEKIMYKLKRIKLYLKPKREGAKASLRKNHADSVQSSRIGVVT